MLTGTAAAEAIQVYMRLGEQRFDAARVGAAVRSSRGRGHLLSALRRAEALYVSLRSRLRRTAPRSRPASLARLAVSQSVAAAPGRPARPRGGR